MNKEQLKKIFWNEKALIIVMIAVLLFTTAYFRSFAYDLAITEDWARDSYYNQIRQGIAQEVSAEFPNLPESQRERFVEERLQEQIRLGGAQLETQIQATAESFKSQLQNEDGHTYLTGIDPYYFYALSRNYVENGHLGDNILEDGRKEFTLRNGREQNIIGTEVFHPWFVVQLYHIGSVFQSDYTLHQAAFVSQVIVMMFGVVFAFFLIREFAGNVGGFIGGLMLALNSLLITRTYAGFNDTDAYLVVMPILIIWMFVKALKAKTIAKTIVFSALAGLSQAVTLIAWNGGWFTGTIILGTLGLLFVIFLIREWNTIKQWNWPTLQKSETAMIVVIGIIFLLSSSIFNMVIMGSTTRLSYSEAFVLPVSDMLGEPLRQLTRFDAVRADTIWPNVLTTVAELNPGSWDQIFRSVNGRIGFIISLLGVGMIFTLYKENRRLAIMMGVVLIVWALPLIYMSLSAVRFISVIGTPFAIAFGAFFGILWKHSQKIKDLMTGNALRVLMIIVFALLLIQPIQAAHQAGKGQVPMMNDTWYGELQAIGQASDDAILTSWWDFGHWFYAISGHRVTFDGGNQGRRIYWVGKSLLTNEVDETKDILRMLQCGQERSYELIRDGLANDSYQAITLLEQSLSLNREDARNLFEQAGVQNVEDVLEKSHCEDYIDQYFIVSEDMVGKAPVWGHFGGWNFTRAQAFNYARGPLNQAIEGLGAIGVDQEEATELYFQASTLRDSRAIAAWISPWPQFITTRSVSCTAEGICQLGIGLQQTSEGVLVLESLVVEENPQDSYLDMGIYQGNTRVASERMVPGMLSVWEDGAWVRYEFENSTFPYHFAVGPNEQGQLRMVAGDMGVADSTFSKLFFFDGLGMEGFEKFSDATSFMGQRIITYTVNLER